MQTSRPPPSAWPWTRATTGFRQRAMVRNMRAMRSADQQLKRIKRTKKQTARKLKKARKNLVRVKSRRAALGERYRSSREELADARAALAAVQVPPPSIDAASAVLEQSGLSLELLPPEACPLSALDQALARLARADVRAVEQLLPGGAREVMHELGRLAEELDMSKSGLFAHFKSKEQLQLQVLEEARQRHARRVGLSLELANAGLLRSPSLEARSASRLTIRSERNISNGCILPRARWA